MRPDEYEQSIAGYFADLVYKVETTSYNFDGKNQNNKCPSSRKGLGND